MGGAGGAPGGTGDAEDVRAVFDNMPVMLAGFAGPEHRVVAVNAAYRAFTGRDDLLGRPVPELFPEMAAQQIFELLDRIYTSGRAESAREWRFQLERGGEIDDIYLDFTCVPHRSASGEVVGVDLVIEDVAERVRQRLAAQERVAAAERRYAAARDVIVALQQELLPPGLPVLPGAPIGASYLLTDADTAAGGDWFDAVPMPDGRVALVVGDVVGHGVAASAVMGQLRAVLADRLADGAGIGPSLAAVDRFAARTPAARAATVGVAVLDPADGSLEHCTAGHPPPLLLPAGGEPRYLAPTGAGPLATGSEFPTATERLDVGDVLLLYSDGIVERPGRTVAASTVELARAAADAAAGRVLVRDGLSAVDRVCTQTLELLVRATGHADDITLLAAQRAAPVPDLELTVPAAPPSVRAVRVALGRWLDGVGAHRADVNALQHAVGELVTNSVEHAYRSGAGAVSVRAALAEGGVVRAEVSDSGQWHDAGTDGARGDGRLRRFRGRGLAMTRELVDSLVVDRGPAGTTAAVARRLSRPARLFADGDVLGAPSSPPPPPPAGPDELLVLDDEDAAQGAGGAPRVRVTGPIDAVTADRLRVELQRRTRGGTRPLSVDLTGATHLASAGVAVLHAAVDASGSGLDLVAAPGSVAQHVMELVALPHRATAGTVARP